MVPTKSEEGMNVTDCFPAEMDPLAVLLEPASVASGDPDGVVAALRIPAAITVRRLVASPGLFMEPLS